MQHVPHHACTHELMPAEGTEDHVSSLFIRRGTQRVGDRTTHTVTSFWKPSHEELAALNRGEHVTLTAWSSSHPAVYIGVEP